MLVRRLLRWHNFGSACKLTLRTFVICLTCYILLVFATLLWTTASTREPDTFNVSLDPAVLIQDSSVYSSVLASLNFPTVDGHDATGYGSAVSVPLPIGQQINEAYAYFNFSYVIRPAFSLCRLHPLTTPFAIVLVNSAAWNHERRDVIRKTWGHHLWYRKLHTATFFIVGASNDSTINAGIAWEAAEHNDIVQGSFTEAYHDMVRKVGMGFHWVLSECPKVTYLLKTDDDMYLNLPLIIQELDQYYIQNGAKRTIFCPYFQGLPPAWNNDSKWYVPQKDFPDPQYPTFCRGSMFVMTNDLLRPIYEHAFKVPYLWLEDVFWSGVVPKAVGGVSYVDWNKHGLYHSENLAEYLVVRDKFWFAHVPDSNARLRVWQFVLRAVKPADVVLAMQQAKRNKKTQR